MVAIRRRALCRILCVVAGLWVVDRTPVFAQDAGTSPDPPTLVPHNPGAPWWLSGQANFIFQSNAAFPARYSGDNSFPSTSGQALSRVLTLYTGLRVNPSTDVTVDLEMAGGSGLSNGAGLGASPDLDVVRNPSLSGHVYLARATVRHVFALSATRERADEGTAGTLANLPVRRIEIRAGKLSTVDLFDVNPVGSDSHLQFMNWAIDNNGAYDYAADTRGYTMGVLAEYDAPRWALRFGECLMPTTANGIVLDWHVRSARAENVELEFRHGVVPHQEGHVRLLAFRNHARMGTYADAITAFLAGDTPTPDLAATRRTGAVKYGFGLNADQAIGRDVRLFVRAGWNDGRTETFAYTEIDRDVSAGADAAGRWWHRPQDRLGLAMVVSGLSAGHRQYLALGGSGFQLGDGGLTYGHERVIEAYYTIPVGRGLFASVDIQHIVNPGFNQDRGPIDVRSLRLHLEF